MSPAPALKRAATPLDLISSDQRSHQRYPVMLELQYKVLDGRRVTHYGHGRTLNVSSGGILFEATDPVGTDSVTTRNQTIELLIEWPMLLGESCALKLLMRGRIVRRDSGRLAVRTVYHEFRTAVVGARNGHTNTEALHNGA